MQMDSSKNGKNKLITYFTVEKEGLPSLNDGPSFIVVRIN